jgi:two-component system, OmpR family, sensor kinase
VDSADELGQLAQKFNEMQWRLARLDTARKEFIANASHELRTPIFSLGGFMELLQDEELDEETREEFLTTMRQQVDRLQKLTTDLLDLSRLDAGSLELELEPVPLRTLANQVAGEFAAAAARKDAVIEVVDREAEIDVEAICDPERVAQIVRVLVDNALVHTPDGTTVSIVARARRDPGAAPTAELLISDDGPGIRRRELVHVFERFHTSDSGPGSGLGLAIAQELAHRMNGTLEVESRPGTTVFTLVLPLAPEREQRPRPRSREPLPA